MGKTQLSHALSVACCIECDRGVLYLDSENTFRPQRLVDIAREKYKGWSEQDEEIKRRILDRVHYRRITTPSDLLQLYPAISADDHDNVCIVWKKWKVL